MIETLTLDTRKGYSPGGKLRISPLRRGERDNVTLSVDVRCDRRPYDLTGMTAHLVWQAADGKLVGPVPMEVDACTVRCTLPDSCYSAVGTARAYIEIRNGAELVDTTDEMFVKVLDCIDANAAAVRAGGAADGAENALAEIKEQAKLVETAEQSRKQAETARVDAEQAREATHASWTAEEAKRVSQEQARVTAEANRETQIAMAKEATDKANASASKADTATAKASEATVAATNAATKANEVEGKLTGNILKGKAKDTFVQVDDAWPSSLLSIEIEGASKQDGTPSPNNPVPIEVIENPTLRVTGRNLLDFSSLTAGYSIETTTGEVYKTASGNLCATLSTIPIPESLDSVTLSGNNPNQPVSLLFYDGDDKFVANRTIGVAPYTFKPPANAKRIRLTADDYDYTMKNVMLEVGKGATYASYSGTSLPFSLPAEHPYLAKLPDGTADTIEVDKDGNVSLVARVGKSIIPETNINVSDELHNGSDGTSNRAVVFGSILTMRNGTSLSGVSSTFVNGGSTQNRDTMRIGYDDKHVYLYTMDADIIGDGSADAVNAWLRTNQPVITYPLETPITYQLGKVTVPSLPDSISNVWTDAEVTPKTSIEYTRDVNISFSNIEDAIASITQG